MDTPNMITLPPKYLKPIYMNVNSTDFQTTTSTTDYQTDYTASALPNRHIAEHGKQHQIRFQKKAEVLNFSLNCLRQKETASGRFP